MIAVFAAKRLYENKETKKRKPGGVYKVINQLEACLLIWFQENHLRANAEKCLRKTFR